MRRKANLLLFAVAIIWGTAFVAQGIAGQYHVAYLFNGLSFMIAGLILLPLVPSRIKISSDQWKWMIVAGLLLFAATALQQVGIFYTQVANAGFLTSLYVVFAPILLWIFFRQRPHKLDLIAVALSIIGAFLLSSPGKFELQKGDALEILGALFWALHFVVLGRYASKFDSISFAAGHFLITGVLNFAVGLGVEDLSILRAPPLIGAITYRATLSIGVGYTLQVWGQKYTPTTDAALILGLEAVFAAIAGWLALGQSLVPLQVSGCAIILFAALLSQAKPESAHSP